MTISEDATVTSRGRVTIPKRIRDALDIDAGTEVEFVLEEDGTIRVRPKAPAMDRLRAVTEALSKHDVDLTALRRASKDEWRSHVDDSKETETEISGN